MGKIDLIPIYNRPREKAYINGVNSLSDNELLAIIIQSGTKNKSAIDISNELISKFNGIENVLNLSSYELCQFEGINKVKAIKIEAIKEIYLRISKKKQHVNEKLKLSSGLDVYNYLTLYYEKALQEKLIVFYLNGKNIVLFEQILSVGNDSMAVTNNKLICKTAIEKYAKKVIVCHNHLSGNSSPSIEDITSNISLKSALHYIQVKLLDNLIIGYGEYYSLIDEIKYNVS